MELIFLGQIYLGLLCIIAVLLFIALLINGFINILHRDSTPSEEINFYMESYKEEFRGFTFFKDIQDITGDKKSAIVEKTIAFALFYPSLKIFYWVFLKTKMMLLVLKTMVKLRNF